MEVPTLREILDMARGKGYLEYFECSARAPPIYDTDNTRIRLLKESLINQSSLFMERYMLAGDFEKVWTDQGWTVHVVKKTYRGYLGPRFMKRLKKLIEHMNIGSWTMVPVEMSWSVVFATKNPSDITIFENL